MFFVTGGLALFRKNGVSTGKLYSVYFTCGGSFDRSVNLFEPFISSCLGVALAETDGAIRRHPRGPGEDLGLELQLFLLYQ